MRILEQPPGPLFWCGSMSYKPRLGRAVLLFLILLATLSSQAFAIDRDVRLKQLNHRAWTTKDGVPAGVHTFAQTSDGALWIGSANGLFRFDGIRFMPFHPSVGPGLPTGPIWSLLAEGDGSLWVASNAISHIIAGKVTTYGVEDGLPDVLTLAMVRDLRGVLWAATVAGVARFDGSRWSKAGADWALPSVEYLSAYVDRKGTLWLGTRTGMYYLLDGEQKFRIASDHLGYVGDIRESSDGTLWIAELARSVHPAQFSKDSGQTRLSEVKVGSTAFLFDRQGSLWIASEGDGLRRVTEPEKLNGVKIGRMSSLADIYTNSDGLSHDFVRKIFEDKEGNIWIATLGGIDRFRQTPLIPLPLPARMADMSLAAGSGDTLWISAANGGLIKSSEHGFHIANFPVPSEACTGATNSLNGDVWFACGRTISRITGDRRAIFNAPSYLYSHPYTSDIAEDTAGVVWIAYGDVGIYRVDKGHWSQFQEWRGQLHQVVSIYADTSGHVWFGRLDGAIDIEDQGKISQTFSREKVGVGAISFIRGRGQDVWVGGERGVALWNGGRFRSIVDFGTHAAGRMAGLIVTRNDGLWIDAGGKLMQIANNEVERWKADASYHVAIRTLDSPNDWLSTIDSRYRGYPKAVEGGDGRLWFTTDQSVFSLDPRRVITEGRPDASVLSIDAGDGELPASPSVTFPTHTTTLRIQYTAWRAKNPEQVQFRYRIENVDRDWQDVGRTRTATYTNLGPGSYSFEVMARDDNGGWYTEPSKIVFSIAPTFYQTTWFKIIELVSVIALVWLFVRVRIRSAGRKFEDRMTERLRERDRIARELHDTLLQGFQGLVLQFQMAANATPSGERSRAMMEQTLQRADLVLAEGRDRVMDLRSMKQDTGGLPELIAKVGEDLCAQYSGHFYLEIQGEARPLNPFVRDEFQAIAREALTNSFRHAQASEIVCEIHFARNQFRLVCRDNGIGIPREFLSKSGRAGHWGLVGIRERAEKIGARASLSRGSVGGTRAEFTVSARIAYASLGNRRWGIFAAKWR
jgi:signal transduction histidine kinase/ligand-binding sensor domain-containing protein